MKNHQSLTYEGITLNVQRATARTGTKRSVMAFRGAAAAGEDPEEVAVLRTITYPDLIAPVIEAKGTLETPGGKVVDFGAWPISFEDFLELPDDLIWKWEKTVYEVNPHWSPNIPQAEQEKKIEKLTDE